MSTDLTVANEILRQLGGNKFLAMTGAKHLAGDADSLQFKLPRSLTHVWCIRIRLVDDMYIVQFWNSPASRDPYRTEYFIMAENLCSLISSETGLALEVH